MSAPVVVSTTGREQCLVAISARGSFGDVGRQGDACGTEDRPDVAAHPMGAGPVRARDHEAVKHGDEDRPLDLDAEAAPGNKRGHGSPAAGLLPHPAEQQKRADAAHLEARIALLDGTRHQGAFGDATDGGDQPVRSARGGKPLPCGLDCR